MSSRCWSLGWQMESLWLFSRLLFMPEANSVENQLFSPRISDNDLSGNQLLDICLPWPHCTLSLSDFNSKIFSYNNQCELSILCGMVFCSPLVMIKFVIFGIGRHLGNFLKSLSVGPLQFASPSSVSVCAPCLSTTSGFMPRTNSWFKSVATSKSEEVERLIY
jgi:hypothetical protein